MYHPRRAHQPLQSWGIQAECSLPHLYAPPCDVRGESASLVSGAESARDSARRRRRCCAFGAVIRSGQGRASALRRVWSVGGRREARADAITVLAARLVRGGSGASVYTRGGIHCDASFRTYSCPPIAPECSHVSVDAILFWAKSGRTLGEEWATCRHNAVIAFARRRRDRSRYTGPQRGAGGAWRHELRRLTTSMPRRTSAPVAPCSIAYRICSVI
jgi:hypothetical protein